MKPIIIGAASLGTDCALIRAVLRAGCAGPAIIIADEITEHNGETARAGLEKLIQILEEPVRNSTMLGICATAALLAPLGADVTSPSLINRQPVQSVGPRPKRGWRNSVKRNKFKRQEKRRRANRK